MTAGAGGPATRLEAVLADLAGLRERLVEAEKMASLGSLVAGVTHEINTPLGVAVTAASHLRRSLRKLVVEAAAAGVPEAFRRRLEALVGAPCELLEENLARTARLVGGFRQVAADQSTEDHRAFDLAAYVGEILTSLGPKIRRAGHRVVLSAPGELIVHGYPFALYPILSNLVINSLVHGYHEGERGTLAVTVDADDERVSICYVDDGRGMAPEVLARIYEPYFTTRRGRGGTGLGMHIVCRQVTRLGGTITCESAPGDGFRARIELPREQRL